MAPASIRSAHERLLRLRRFFTTGLWEAGLMETPGWRKTAVRILRAGCAAGTEFFKDQCMLRASALTFYTLMSIVPFLAVLFGIAQGFGLEKLLERELLARMAGQEQALERILLFARNLLENTRGGIMAGVGVAVMLWSVIKVLGQIESALNGIWDVRKPRRWVRKLTDYLAMMLIAPILLVTAGSAPIFIRTQIDAAAGRFDLVDTVAPLMDLALELGPLALVWALFTLVYLLMPNTRVPWRAALAGGLFAGTLFHLLQSFYIAFQVGVSSRNVIYGSFAALPLFLGWVQISWTILLFGAEFGYAFGQVDTYVCPSGAPEPSLFGKKVLGLAIARRLARDFAEERPPTALAALARELRLPARLIEQAAEELKRGGIIAEVRGRSRGGRAFQPAFDLRRLTVGRVVAAIEEQATPLEHKNASDDISIAHNMLCDFHGAALGSPANRPLVAV